MAVRRSVTTSSTDDASRRATALPRAPQVGRAAAIPATRSPAACYVVSSRGRVSLWAVILYGLRVVASRFPRQLCSATSLSFPLPSSGGIHETQGPAWLDRAAPAHGLHRGSYGAVHF